MLGKHPRLKGDGLVAEIQEGEITRDFYRGESWAVGNLRVKTQVRLDSLQVGCMLSANPRLPKHMSSYQKSLRNPGEAVASTGRRSHRGDMYSDTARTVS